MDHWGRVIPDAMVLMLARFCEPLCCSYRGANKTRWRSVGWGKEEGVTDFSTIGFPFFPFQFTVKFALDNYQPSSFDEFSYS
jgi:hypothetical protein